MPLITAHPQAGNPDLQMTSRQRNPNPLKKIQKKPQRRRKLQLLRRQNKVLLDPYLTPAVIDGVFSFNMGGLYADQRYRHKDQEKNHQSDPG